MEEKEELDPHRRYYILLDLPSELSWNDIKKRLGRQYESDVNILERYYSVGRLSLKFRIKNLMYRLLFGRSYIESLEDKVRKNLEKILLIQARAKGKLIRKVDIFFYANGAEIYYIPMNKSKILEYRKIPLARDRAILDNLNRSPFYNSLN